MSIKDQKAPPDPNRMRECPRFYGYSYPRFREGRGAVNSLADLSPSVFWSRPRLLGRWHHLTSERTARRNGTVTSESRMLYCVFKSNMQLGGKSTGPDGKAEPGWQSPCLLPPPVSLSYKNAVGLLGAASSRSPVGDPSFMFEGSLILGGKICCGVERQIPTIQGFTFI